MDREDKILQNVLLAGIREQQRARRWGIFFKLVFLSLIVFVIYSSQSEKIVKKTDFVKGHTALINIEGQISANDEASSENIIKALNSAYKSKDVKGIVLRINSPGGSPVQSRQIYDEIRRQKDLHKDIKIYAAIEDLGASAAYLIASAVDEIYANASSLVGSIGVSIDSFGFVNTMEKIGVERRLYTSGDHKNMLDPFSPVSSDDKAFIDGQLNKIHNQFIANVVTGRGNRLKTDTPDLFSGRFWSGEDALTLGLIDGFASYRDIARDKIKADSIVDYSYKDTLFDKLTNKLGGKLQKSLLNLFSYMEVRSHIGN
jgi:protease IV